MEHACATITVCFEEPFWIALYERIEAGHCTVCKITFGAEPKDYEVYQFLLDHWRHLPFSPPVPVEQGERKRLNPKRVQREIKKQRRNHSYAVFHAISFGLAVAVQQRHCFGQLLQLHHGVPSGDAILL